MDRPQRLEGVWIWCNSFPYSLQQASSRMMLAVYHIGVANSFSFQAAHLSRAELLANRTGDSRVCMDSKKGGAYN